jgi:histidine triad (HIT) family protein
MDDCIFCRIVRGEIPSPRVYEDDTLIAIHDIHPVAPVHLLLIPKRHFKDLLDLGGDPEGPAAAAAMARALPAVARAAGLPDGGFRLISNCGSEAGQTVMHLHWHLLGGRDFGEKLL